MGWAFLRWWMEIDGLGMWFGIFEEVGNLGSERDGYDARFKASESLFLGIKALC